MLAVPNVIALYVLRSSRQLVKVLKALLVVPMVGSSSLHGPTPIPDAVSLEDALLDPNSVAQAVAPEIQGENEPSSGSWSVGSVALVVSVVSFFVSLPLLEVVFDTILRVLYLKL